MTMQHLNYEIPEDEVENVLDLYWQMLRELESKADGSKDELLKILVEGGYIYIT